MVVALEKEGDSLNPNNILSYLKKVRPLFSYVVDSPDKLLRDLASIVPSKHMIFSCDIIDLRSFLIKDRIVSSNPILLFSNQFAEKYLKDYSLFLVLDAIDLAEGKTIRVSEICPVRLLFRAFR